MARKPKFISLGFVAISWIEHYLVHGPGDVEGEPIELDDEFAAFTIKSYRLSPTGTRLVRRSAISRPKGRAKSEYAAMIACFEGLGPARFHHFAVRGEVSPWGYAYQVGEPVGAPVKRPAISCFATEYGQAGNTYDAIRYMLHADTASARLIAAYGKIDVGITRILLPGGGTIEPETAKDTSKDGGKETFLVVDESHLWTLPTIKRLHQVVIRNLLKRKIASGWCLETTTMFAPGGGSVAEETHAYARQLAESGVPSPRFVFDHKQAGPKWDVTKRADRLAGLREVYGPAAAWMDLEAIADSFDEPQTSDAEWQRYWWNRPVSIQGSFVSERAYVECHIAREIPDHADVVLALDGSYNGDSTGIIAVQMGEFPHTVVGGLWERDENDPDWKINYQDVEEHVRMLCRRWRVVEVTADPFRWARSLEVLAESGVPVTEYPQSAARMSPATKRLKDMIDTRTVSHDGDLRLARHVSNAVLKEDARGIRLAKESKTSSKRIDLAVCWAMALDRAVSYVPEPAVPAPFFIA